LREPAAAVDRGPLAEELLHVIQEVLSRHRHAEALLEAEIDVDEIQRLGGEIADERHVGLHFLRGDLQGISDGFLDLAINLIWADQYLGHSLLVSVLCLGWLSNVSWRGQSATAGWRARLRRRSAGPGCSAPRAGRERTPRSPPP